MSKANLAQLRAFGPAQPASAAAAAVRPLANAGGNNAPTAGSLPTDARPSAMRPDEERMLEKLRQRDEQGLRDLLRGFGGPVLTILTRRFRGRLGREECEEALTLGAHEVWRNVMDRFDANRPGASLRNWFAGCALIQAHRLLVERNRTAPSRGPYDEFAAIENDSLVAEVRERIASLPSPQNHIMTAWLESNGRPNYCRLAKVLGLSVTMTWKHAQRAKEALRSKLAESGLISPTGNRGSKRCDS